MKKIYKVLISILIISMLTATAISAVTGPYTGCVSKSATKYDVKGIFYYFQPGSTPISTCKTGDYQITIYEKTYIDNALNFLQTQISSLVSRITNLENNQRYIQGSSAQFLMDQPIDNNMKTINTTVFDLPGDSNVYVEVSGYISGSTNPNTFYIAMDVDKDPCIAPNACYAKDLRYISNPSDQIGIQRSEVYRLSKGSHTIYLDAGWSLSAPQNIFMIVNYNIVTSAVTPGSLSTTNTKNRIATTKDGKLTIDGKLIPR